MELVPQTDLHIEPAPEEGATFVENALAKARHASRASGLPAIADDSGLCVDALRSVPEHERGARFYCVLVALRSPDDPAPLIGSGEWRGRIATRPRGSGGFGYDPIFVDPATGLSAAELSPETKNLVSHRGQALRALAAGLRGRLAVGESQTLR